MYPLPAPPTIRLSHAQKLVASCEIRSEVRSKSELSRCAFHLSGIADENFPANGAVQFLSKHNGTGRVCSVKNEKSGEKGGKKREKWNTFKGFE